MRLIDADALMEDIRKNSASYFADDFAHEWVDKQPTVDVELVKHEKWIRDEFGARCSGCGLYSYRDKFDKPWESPYCPICGAKMDG